MQPFLELLKRYTENHTFDFCDPDCQTVLDQLYRAYAESHENDPLEIRDGFAQLESFLETLPLEDTMPFGICAAGFAWPMNTKPLLMASITASS